MSKNNSSSNPKKGKSLAPNPNPNPASVDLFSDEALAEAVTVPNSESSETAYIEDVLDADDDSVKDADFEPSKERETESDDEDSEGEDETDINKSPLVKKVTKSVKAAMKDVPELHPADRKPNEGAIWNYFSKRIERDENDVLIKKEAICNVINPAVGRGVPCGTSLKQPGCSTTGPRNHLKRKHPKQWAELLAIEHAKVQVKRGARRVLHETFDTLEGEKKIETNIHIVQLFANHNE